MAATSSGRTLSPGEAEALQAAAHFDSGRSKKKKGGVKKHNVKTV